MEFLFSYKQKKKKILPKEKKKKRERREKTRVLVESKTVMNCNFCKV